MATRFMLYGTHKGEWMGLAPMNKEIALPGAGIFWVAGGKIKEVRVFYDTLGLMQQLGVIPSPEQAVAR